MARAYEAVFIVDPAVGDEEAVDQMAERMVAVVRDQGGTVTQVDKWGKRRLAYEIDGKGEGHYVLLQFEGESNVAHELERVFRITDAVIRHLVVRQPEPRRRAAEQAEPKGA